MSSMTQSNASSLLREGISTSVATFIACLCAFMVVMDGSIVNVSLTAMQHDLSLSSVGLQWVVDIYLLMLGGFMLLAARAGDIFGRRAVLLWGLVFFTGASFVGGCALNSTMLLVSRAIQGFGAAALATSPLAVIMAAHSKGAGRERAIGLWAACAAMGSAFGVVIGGVLTSYLGWRWIMFVNVPIGLILMMIVRVSLNSSNPHDVRSGLDVPGAVTITLALGAFMFAISQSIHAGWYSSTVLAAMSIAITSFFAFLMIELRSKESLIRLNIFQIRNVPIGMVMITGLGAILTSSTFFLAQVLQQIDGYNAFETGLALLPQALMLAISALLSRRLRDAGVRQLPFIGGIVSAVGLIWLNWLPVHPSYLNDLLMPTLLVGVGCGLTMMSATQAVLSGVPQHESGLAAGLQNTSRQLGGAIGIAILVTLSHHVSSELLAAGQTQQMADLGGYRIAFLVSGIIGGVSAFVSLLLRRD